LSKYLTEQLMTRIYKNLRKNRGRKPSVTDIHATDILKICLREKLILYQKGLLKDNNDLYISNGRYVTFMLGNKIEDIILELIEGIKPPVMGLKIGDIRLIGSPDGIITLNEKKYIVECKSINREAFNNLTSPVPNHLYQLSFYCWISEKLKLDYDYNIGIIIYMAKEEVKEPIKLFVAERDEYVCNIYEQTLKNLKRFVKYGELPERVCANTNTQLAKTCIVREECFALKERHS